MYIKVTELFQLIPKDKVTSCVNRSGLGQYNLV